MGSLSEVKVAVVQHPPVLLDKAATLTAVVERLHEAADTGAGLVVFPETYVPGYPAWLWSLRPGDDFILTDEIYRVLLENSVDLARDDLKSIRTAAAERGVVVVVGVHERDSEYSRATLYNTLVTIGADGTVLNRHRKLVPTNPERMVWGQGDASGLRVVETPFGRLGGLICWENYMPLARFALYAEGVEVYVASTWDCGPSWVASMQHIAKEGRCWVIGSGCSFRTADVPLSFPGLATAFPSSTDWLNTGDSVIVAPGGDIVAGPLHKQHGMLYATIDVGLSAAGHRTIDVAGHYGRPDVFQLTINRGRSAPVTYL